MAGNTRLQVQTECYQILWEKDLSNEYSPDKVQAKIQDVYTRISHMKIIRLDNGQAITAKRLPFLEKREAFQLYDGSTVSVVANPGDTEISIVDTTNYLNATPTDPKAIYVKGNLVIYTGKTSTQLTWVSWLVIKLDMGDLVQQVFLLSNIDVYAPTKLIYQRWVTGYNCYFLEPGQYTTSKFYSIVNNGEDRYLWINGYPTWAYWMNYSKEVTKLTADTSVLELPDDAWLFIVAPIAMAELLWKTEEIEFAKEKWVLGYNALIEFYDIYNSQIKRNNQQVVFNFTSSEEITGARDSGEFGDDSF